MGIIKDGWDISKEVLKPVFTGHLTKHANKKRNRDILLSFSKEFASHEGRSWVSTRQRTKMSRSKVSEACT